MTQILSRQWSSLFAILWCLKKSFGPRSISCNNPFKAQNFFKVTICLGQLHSSGQLFVVCWTLFAGCLDILFSQRPQRRVKQNLCNSVLRHIITETRCKKTIIITKSGTPQQRFLTSKCKTNHFISDNYRVTHIREI
jgi:hypothetical protein